MKEITLGVSDIKYDVKPESIQGIKYTKTTLNLDEFVNLIKQGHVFCHNYRNFSSFWMTQKTNSNFSGTNLIWFDFDHCKYTIDELYSFAKIKPTIAYTTLRNRLGDNRFRFMYILDEKIVSSDEYQNRTNLFLNLVLEKEIVWGLIKDEGIDFCSFSAHQQFLGSNSSCKLIFNPDVIITSKIISKFFQKAKTNVNEECNSDVDKYFKKFEIVDSFSNEIIIDYFEYKCPENSKNKNKKKKKTVLENGKNMTDIIEKANKIVSDIRFIPTLNNFDNVSYSSDVYTFVGDQNIYAVNTYFGENKKVFEGKRNNAAYYQANVIVNINSNIKIEELVANLIWLRNKYYENPETFTHKEIVYTATNVLNERSENDMGKKKYVIHPEYKSLAKSEKMKYLGEARRKRRDDIILPNFDSNISVKENAFTLGVSTSTIYNSIKYNCVNTKTENEYFIFKEKYFETDEENRTVRKMAKIADVNKGKSERYIRKIKSDENSFQNV
jgi:hypothetical protein